jgi:hypothetical protein
METPVKCTFDGAANPSTPEGQWVSAGASAGMGTVRLSRTITGTPTTSPIT